ncbi:MAG: alpha/beta hydrolase, partial [Psychrosphaera sp.]|nr:alpha/beta hydrolase [Psychrosphaera sp.]
TIVLLSGPNKYFHADSAWFVTVQQQLAKHYKVRAIDRPGNGWSDFDETTSYVGFVDKLYQTLVVLDEKDVIFVTFSSGNTTASLFQKKYSQNSKIKLKGMVWIDPDIFLPHSIAMYQDYPVTYYRKNLAELLPHLETGAWTERTLKKLVAEREEIQTLTQGKSMDWGYYDAISQQRLLIDRQQTRSLEIAHYHDDLNAVANLDLIEQIPVSVIDSDFELEQIKEQIKDNPDAAKVMTKWMEEGTQWAKRVAQKSKGQYIEVKNAHHLVPLQHPDVIVDAVKWLAGRL